MKTIIGLLLEAAQLQIEGTIAVTTAVLRALLLTLSVKILENFVGAKFYCHNALAISN